MANYDGSQLGRHKNKSSALIQTAVNMVEHCILVSAAKSNESICRLEGGRVRAYQNKIISNPFQVIGGSFIRPKKSSSQALAYIAENDNAVVISFRGSGVKNQDGNDMAKTLDNALVDVNFKLTRDKKFSGKVHRGFIAEYNLLRNEIKSRLKKTSFASSGKPVYVTGFSLGAGLASLCALDLKNNIDPEMNLHVYLFAQPAAGDHDFTREFNRKLSNVFRFAHEKDVVSQIPHSLVCPYKAPGKKLLVFNNKGEQVHHSKIKLLIKAKRLTALTVLPKKLRRTMLAATALKIALSFKIVHQPELYKKKLARLHLNYAANINKSSSLLQAAEKQYQECQQHCLDM